MSPLGDVLPAGVSTGHTPWVIRSPRLLPPSQQDLPPNSLSPRRSQSSLSARLFPGATAVFCAGGRWTLEMCVSLICSSSAQCKVSRRPANIPMALIMRVFRCLSVAPVCVYGHSFPVGDRCRCRGLWFLIRAWRAVGGDQKAREDQKQNNPPSAARAAALRGGSCPLIFYSCSTPPARRTHTCSQAHTSLPGRWWRRTVDKFEEMPSSKGKSRLMRCLSASRHWCEAARAPEMLVPRSLPGPRVQLIPQSTPNPVNAYDLI